MKTLRIALFLLMAAILILASLGAGKTVKEGLEDERVMHSGRRTSRLIDKATDPNWYWLQMGYTGVICAGLFAGGVWLAVRAFVPGKRRM